MATRRLPAAIFLCTLALARPGRAGDAATAEALFREGRSLMDAGNFAAACPKLAESFEQDAATGTLLALAMCQEGAGQNASAWANYAVVVSRAKQDGRADREEAARERMTALEPKLSRLTITVDDATAAVVDLVVKRDGKPVGKAVWGAALPLDPGEHVIEATAPGKLPWKATVTIGPGADKQSVRVPALENAPEPPSGAATASTAGSVDRGVAPESEVGPPLRTIGLVVGGVGIVGLGLGGFFGFRASSLSDESNADGHCDAQNQCDPTGGAKRDDAITAATASTVAFVAGGVLAAAGIALFIVGEPDSEASATRMEAAPLVARDGAGVALRGAF